MAEHTLFKDSQYYSYTFCCAIVVIVLIEIFLKLNCYTLKFCVAIYIYTALHTSMFCLFVVVVCVSLQERFSHYLGAGDGSGSGGSHGIPRHGHRGH